MTNYYVKNGGDNSRTGLSDDQAWETIVKVNDFAATLKFKDYGTGDKPFFDGK